MGSTDRILPLRELQEKLRKQHSELLASLRINSDAADAVELDQTRQGRVTRMDAMQQQAMAVANRATSRARIAAIEAALARIDADEYGDCLQCGMEIAAARLAAYPEARLCISCKAGNEQR